MEHIDFGSIKISQQLKSYYTFSSIQNSSKIFSVFPAFSKNSTYVLDIKSENNISQIIIHLDDKTIA